MHCVHDSQAGATNALSLTTSPPPPHVHCFISFTASHTIRAVYGGTFLAGGGLRAFQTGTFASSSIVDQLTFKEMGLLSWLIVDAAINWGGWALAVLFKVGGLPRLAPIGSMVATSSRQGKLKSRSALVAFHAVCVS